MGERGPAPRPVALTLLDGTSHHNINKDAPSLQMPDGIPEPPPWLSESAVEEWVEICQEMSQVRGWLNKTNKTTLSGHCHWYSVWVEAEAVLAKEGRFYDQILGQDPETGETSSIKKLHPMVKVSREAWSAMVKCDQELGITPARGSSVKLPSGDRSDEEGLDGVRAG